MIMAAMDIYIIGEPATDELFEPVDIIDKYLSCIWTTQFFGSDEFQLQVPYTYQNLKRLTRGAMLCRDFDITETTSGKKYRHVMMVENRRIDYNAETGYVLTVSGRGIKRKLAQRIVITRTALNGTVESGLRQLVSDAFELGTVRNIARRVHNLRLGDTVGISDAWETQIYTDNLLDIIQKTCETYGCGYELFIEGAYYVFQLIKGTDRTYDNGAVDPVVFSPEYDNLISATYNNEIIDYHNTGKLIADDIDNDSSETRGTFGLKIYGNNVQPGAWDRFETVIDCKSLKADSIVTAEEFLQIAKAYGETQLTPIAEKESITGQVLDSPNQSGATLYHINRDYFLGDTVQIEFGSIQNEDGLSTPLLRGQVRITEVVHSIDEDGEKMLATYDGWQILDTTTGKTESSIKIIDEPTAPEIDMGVLGVSQLDRFLLS